MDNTHLTLWLVVMVKSHIEFNKIYVGKHTEKVYIFYLPLI